MEEAIGAADAYIVNIKLLIGGVVAEDKLPHLAYPRFALHADVRGHVLAAGAVVFKALHRAIGFVNNRFLGVIRGFCGGFGGAVVRGGSGRFSVILSCSKQG